MKSTYFGSMLALILTTGAMVVGCGDEDSTTTTTTTTTTTATGTGGQGGEASTSSTASSGGNTGQGGAGTGGAGTGGSDVAADAAAFCDDYEKTCGFGDTNYFASKEDCVGDYTNKFDDARRACVKMHLGLAAGNAALHCPHAAGQAPCN